MPICALDEAQEEVPDCARGRGRGWEEKYEHLLDQPRDQVEEAKDVEVISRAYGEKPDYKREFKHARDADKTSDQHEVRCTRSSSYQIILTYMSLSYIGNTIMSASKHTFSSANTDWGGGSPPELSGEEDRCIMLNEKFDECEEEGQRRARVSTQI